MQTARDRLTELWVSHQPTVQAYIRARAEHSQVDDVVSQTFTIAWQRIDAVPADALPWLLVVARNLLMHQGRTARRQAALAVRAQPLASVEPGAEASALTRVALVRAWSALTDDQRETLALVAWDGLSAEQAATVLGISRVAFSVRLLRARRRLEALMAAQEPARQAAWSTGGDPDIRQDDGAGPVAVSERSADRRRDDALRPAGPLVLTASLETA